MTAGIELGTLLEPGVTMTVATGCDGSGKTSWLVQRVASLIETGVAPHDIVVLCATPVAAQDMTARLAKRGAAGVEALTPLAWALGILADAAREDGRPAPRVLLPFETEVLWGDLSLLGIRRERLDQMLRFFGRSWSDLDHWTDGWLVTYEERALAAALDEFWETTGAALATQIVPRALDYLRSRGDVPAAWKRGHVLVDDAELLSRASLALAGLTAGASLALTAWPGETCVVGEPFPWRGDVGEVCRGRANAELVELDGASVGVCDGGREVSVMACDSAADEFVLVARSVRERIDAGIPAGQICVVAPHPTWRANLALALGQEGVAVDVLPDAAAFGPYGVLAFRDVCVRSLVLLELVADPSDVLALRSWCGLGDHFARASAFAELWVSAKEAGCSLVDALARTRDKEGIGVARGLLAIWDRAGEILDGDLAGLRGLPLIERACRAAACEVARERNAGEVAGIEDARWSGLADRAAEVLRGLCCPQVDEAAKAMVNRARCMLTQPRFAGESGAVRMCDLRSSWGLSPDFSLASGCMNGFVPTVDVLAAGVLSAAQERSLGAQRRMLRRLASDSSRECIATWTMRMPVADADRLGLVTGRIRLEDGERIALLERSVLLE